MRNNMMKMAALMALAGTGALDVYDEPRAADVTVKRPRNYDIEGPEHVPAPPEPLTRQQRRWQERQAKKHR